MIPLGKTHMVEFAFGGWGRNQPMGAPWNPWDMTTHRVAGGSSSGSAVAVAAGSGAGGHRLRYRRIDPHSRVAVRPDRPQDDLRPHQPPRRRSAVDDARLARAAHAHRRRRRAADGGDGRTRSARPGDAGRAALRRRRRARRRTRRSRHAHHRAGGRTVHRRCRSRRFARAHAEMIALLRSLGAAVEEARFPDRLRGPDGAQRQADRDRGLRVSSRQRRGRERCRSIRGCASACWAASRDQRGRLHRRPGVQASRQRGISPTGCAVATRCSRPRCRSPRRRSPTWTKQRRRWRRTRASPITSAPARCRCPVEPARRACRSACSSSALRLRKSRLSGSGAPCSARRQWHLRHPLL